MRRKFNFKFCASIGAIFFSFWSPHLIAEPSKKNFVSFESINNNLFIMVMGNIGQIIMLVLIISLLTYYTLTWRKLRTFGGTIIPLFEPPKNLSPAAVAYISRLHLPDEKLILSAVVVDLAIKGFLKIKKMGDGYTIQKIKNPVNDIPIEESIVLRSLFKETDIITFETSNGKRIERVIAELSETLSQHYTVPYFSNNFSYIIKGLFWSVVAFRLIDLIGSDKFFSDLRMVSIVTLFSLIFLFSLGFDVNNFFKKSSTVSLSFFQLLADSFRFVVILAIFGTVILGFIKQSFAKDLYIFLSNMSGSILIIIHAVFFFLLKQPTVMGRKIMDEIEGFKLFLSITEKDRYKILSSSETKADIFEKYLPYAIALGVEGGWNEQLREGFLPNWYEDENNEMRGSNLGEIGSIGSSMHANLNKVTPNIKKNGGFFWWKQAWFLLNAK